MTIKWEQNVFSSNIDSVAYDDAGEMIVKWSNGRVSAYSGVPEELAHEISNSPSVGSAVSSEIKKGGYAHRYIG